MTPISGIIFDMDGIVVDSEPPCHRATQAALGDGGPSYTERDNRAFFGAMDDELLRVLRILFDLPAATADLVEIKRARLIALIHAEARPLPGVPGVPRALRESGIRLGLASASPRPVIRAVLGTVGLASAFEAIVSGDEAGRGKPAPGVFVIAARRLGVAPENCLVVENSRSGVLAARAAGMRVAAIPCAATSHEDFSAADFMLPSLEGLPKLLGLNGA